jgi:putative SOS response-associated peptidase YedK
VCGRYGIGRDGEALSRELAAGWRGAPFDGRWNVAPSQHAPVVLQEEGLLWLESFRWGLCVAWAKDRGIPTEPVNARAEDVASKPFFRSAFERRRCLVPANGFYEWRRTARGKIPYWIHLPGGDLLTFAGLWECWAPQDAEPVYSFTILTTSPSEAVRPIHDRMPVVLNPEERLIWLDPHSRRAELQRLLRPYREPLVMHPVSERVNSPVNDGPELVEPAPGG